MSRPQEERNCTKRMSSTRFAAHVLLTGFVPTRVNPATAHRERHADDCSLAWATKIEGAPGVPDLARSGCPPCSSILPGSRRGLWRHNNEASENQASLKSGMQRFADFTQWLAKPPTVNASLTAGYSGNFGAERAPGTAKTLLQSPIHAEGRNRSGEAKESMFGRMSVMFGRTWCKYPLSQHMLLKHVGFARKIATIQHKTVKIFEFGRIWAQFARCWTP